VAETGRLRGEEGMGLGGSRGGLKETWWSCLLGEVERACVWYYTRWLECWRAGWLSRGFRSGRSKSSESASVDESDMALELLSLGFGPSLLYPSQLGKHCRLVSLYEPAEINHTCCLRCRRCRLEKCDLSRASSPFASPCSYSADLVKI
jgi:hypothetical protein